jgi:hypothetical protein
MMLWAAGELPAASLQPALDSCANLPGRSLKVGFG